MTEITPPLSGHTSTFLWRKLPNPYVFLLEGGGQKGTKRSSGLAKSTCSFVFHPFLFVAFGPYNRIVLTTPSQRPKHRCSSKALTLPLT